MTTKTTDTQQDARDLAERFWEGVLALEPIVGTYIGDERYDDRLPDPSDEGVAARVSFIEQALADAAAIDRSQLDVELRTTLDVLESGSRRELESAKYRMDRLGAVTHLFGPGNLLADVGTLQRADTPERLERYLGRLGAVSGYLDALGKVAMDGARLGQVSPGLVVDRSIAQIDRLLAMEPKESPGMAPVTEASSEAKDRVEAALSGEVWPAYQRFLDTLKAYRTSARDTIGLSALPDGEAMYASAILSYTTLPLEAQRVHDIGREQLALIQEQRTEIANRLGHPDADAAVAAHNASGKNTAKSRDEMLRLVEEQVERSWDVAPAWFGRLPDANCLVRPVEEFREDDMPGAYYQPPTADGSRPGVYYMNTGHLDQRWLHQTATTTFHEANPGHHFQISIEQQFTDRLPLRRFGGFLVGDAFGEGWGLYAELLADEMGLFIDDYERLGMLEAQAFRAGRLIVDTGIHALGWDRERAVRQMQGTGASLADSEIEVDRYIAMPGQALAYMIGRLEIQRWRREAAERQGSAFDLRAFHDHLLELGSLPLGALERELKG